MNGWNVGGLGVHVRRGDIKATAFADELEGGD